MAVAAATPRGRWLFGPLPDLMLGCGLAYLLVFVLLLGEIDLAAGTAGGLCAGLAAQAVFSHGLHEGVAGFSSLDEFTDIFLL